MHSEDFYPSVWKSQYAFTSQDPKIKSILQLNWLTEWRIIQTVHENENEPT